MKQICRFLFLLLIITKANAQDSTAGRINGADSTASKAPVVKPDSAARIRKPIVRIARPVDTSRVPAIVQAPDSLSVVSDTTSAIEDSLAAKDSINIKKPAAPVRHALSYKDVVYNNPWYNFKGKPMEQLAAKREDDGKEGQFYLLCGVVFFFALIKLIFGKYLQNLFAVFFRVSMKQKQLREQLLQTPFPSLLLNLLFVITGGIYTFYLVRYYGVFKDVNQWLLILYASAGLAVIYIVKLLVLKLTGWIFNMKEATDTYIFVVFLVNKLLGIFLIPFILLIAFSEEDVASVIITLSFIAVFIFFGYRYLISYSAVRKEIKVSPFHFFLYLCAFEIIPLVLIYKVLLEFVYRSP